LLVLLAPLVAALPSCAPPRAEGDGSGSGPAVSFRPPADRVEVYDFAEVTAQVRQPGEGNPFTQVSVRGRFHPDAHEPATVGGFCHAAEGTLFRVRYLAARPGRYQYSVTYERPGQRETHEGSFEAVGGKRRGVLRVDRDHPWHFVWEGTGELFFFNGTT